MDVIPWVEKYRPKKLKEIVGHEEIIKRLENYVQTKNLPNFLFAGPAGVGKTATVLALAHELFKDTISQNFLELNASDERGIDVIRGKIKDFAATLPYGDVKFKIIFLDEADALTKDAQNALRRTMETYANTTRFCLSCNYSSRIIEPIQSRCVLLRFKPLSKEEIIKRLKMIAEKEKVNCTDDGYEALVYASEGDLRKAINLLQTASALGEKVTEKIVFKIAARARPKEVKELIEYALKGKFEASREKLDFLLYEYGLSGEDIMLQIYKEIINSKLDPRHKVELIDKIGEYDFRLSEGANERIQLEAMLAYFVLFGEKNKLTEV
ncbi:MAG: replication factor C small subunit [archaeon]